MAGAASATIQLIFVDADQNFPDPAAVGAIARNIVGGLRATGENLTPEYTGTRGAGEVFAWLVGAAIVIGPIITLADFSLKLAQLLNELKKLKSGEPASPHQIYITLIVRSEQAVAEISASTQSDPDNLLAQLLAANLPSEIRPAATTITVQVPPTPPNEI